MLGFLNFGPYEFIVVLIVAILIFGRNLPTVVVQAAAMVQKMRRSLTDLRRETGIDEELRNARRELENAVPRDLTKDLDVAKIVEREVEKAAAATDEPQVPPPDEDDGRREEG
jgi:Sec-independent protein translocase protein TatA